jgi:hypothetical protein
MNKYVVIKPLSQVTPETGFKTYTHGDLIELDEKDAARMIEAGIVASAPAADAARVEPTKSRELSGIETADVKPEGVEKTVKVKGAKK